jgi:DNA polymerase
VSGVVVHNCGYEGGANAFATMAHGYGVDLTGVDTKEIVKKWRSNRPMTVSWWRELSQSAIRAIQNPGEIVVARSVSFRCNDMYLMCKLPSGRSLYYPTPSVGEKMAPWGDMMPVINFRSTDLTGKWCEHETYGGRLSENITQAVCRDILALALLRLEAAGYPVILHVHDEVLAEVPEGYGSLDEFCRLMAQVPDWAHGFPIAAEGWIGGRYRK